MFKIKRLNSILMTQLQCLNGMQHGSPEGGLGAGIKEGSAAAGGVDGCSFQEPLHH